MSDSSFVETLDLASDPRMLALRPAAEIAPEPARRQRGGAPAPEAIGAGLRAAVNAGALVSFVAGLSEAETSDVLCSTQLAHRAAGAQHDQFADTKAWYACYIEVLTRLGWACGGFAFTERARTAGTFTIDRSALDVIMAIATANQLAILVKTLDTLKGLADASGAIRVFEFQAIAGSSGNFQLGAAQRAENGALSLALGAFHFRMRDARKRALFVRWGAEEIAFWTGAQMLTLNQTLYAQHREAVAARLAADAALYIASIPIV